MFSSLGNSFVEVHDGIDQNRGGRDLVRRQALRFGRGADSEEPLGLLWVGFVVGDLLLVQSEKDLEFLLPRKATGERPECFRDERAGRVWMCFKELGCHYARRLHELWPVQEDECLQRRGGNFPANPADITFGGVEGHHYRSGSGSFPPGVDATPVEVGSFPWV